MMKEQRKGRGIPAPASEWIALAAVMNHCLFLFLESTTFWIHFTQPYRTASWLLIVCAGVFRLITGLYGDLKGAGTAAEKRRILFRAALPAACVVPCAVIAARYGYTLLIYIPFAAFCLYGMEPERVLKALLACVGTALAVTVLCALSGSIENFLFPGYGRRGQIRAAYGVGYPTDFASYCVFLLLFAWCAGKRRGKLYTALYACLALLTAWLMYTYPHSETSTFCSLLTAALILYDAAVGALEKRAKGSRFVRAGDALLTWAFPALGILMWVLILLYGSGNPAAVQVNGLLSDRLNLTWKALQKYGLHAFGALTPQNGWGGALAKNYEYEFLDSTYALLPIRYGWVLALLFGATWVWMTRRMLKAGRRRIACAMALIAFHSFAEHHFPEINYNILLAMPLCCLSGRKPETEEEPVRKQAVRIAGGLAVAAAGILLLPGILSRVRCLFALSGWTGGMPRSLYALLFWFGCIFLLTLAGIFLRKTVAERRRPEQPFRYGLAGLVITVCLLLAGWGAMNGRITDGAAAYDRRLEAERPAVEAVLAAASEPVYAGETEELYRQKFGGISGRILSAEEIARGGKGSALLKRKNRGDALIMTGAMYTELSPYTGLFTYDRELMAQMEAQGYRFHDRYGAGED